MFIYAYMACMRTIGVVDLFSKNASKPLVNWLVRYNFVTLKKMNNGISNNK